MTAQFLRSFFYGIYKDRTTSAVLFSKLDILSLTRSAKNNMQVSHSKIKNKISFSGYNKYFLNFFYLSLTSAILYLVYN